MSNTTERADNIVPPKDEVAPPKKSVVIKDVAAEALSTPNPVKDSETHILIGTCAGANLLPSSQYNCLIGINAGRSIRKGRNNIIIADNEFGQDIDGQVIISTRIPHIEDHRLSIVLNMLESVQRKLLNQFASRISQTTLNDALLSISRIHEHCTLRIRILECPLQQTADTIYLAHLNNTV
jgi:hypothetical protein